MTSQILTSAPLKRFQDSKKFALMLACASIVMLFVAFTSAYVVRKAAGNWLEFRLPAAFLYSAVLMLASSLTAHLGLKAFMIRNVKQFRIWTILTFLLGIAFIAMQVTGWYDLKSIGVSLDGNPSGSFIYVISGTHAAHVLGGLAALFLSLRIAFKSNLFTENNKLHLEMVNIYWHFVDALWIYLVVFFILQ